MKKIEITGKSINEITEMTADMQNSFIRREGSRVFLLMPERFTALGVRTEIKELFLQKKKEYEQQHNIKLSISEYLEILLRRW